MTNIKYMGSKKKLQSHISPILNNIIIENKIKTYIEPFVGGANMIESICCENKIGYDNNKYLIALLDYVSKNGLIDLPKIIEREHYNDVRDSFNIQDGRYNDYYIGYIGFMGSYNGRFFDGGYSGHAVVVKDMKNPRDYIRQTIENLEQQVEKLTNIKFVLSDFKETSFENCLIYCDPPYKNSKQYGTSKSFPYEEFYQWCIEMSEKNIVLISEYSMPNDFECIWQKEHKTHMNQKTENRIEKLFVYNKTRE